MTDQDRDQSSSGDSLGRVFCRLSRRLPRNRQTAITSSGENQSILSRLIKSLSQNVRKLKQSTLKLGLYPG